MRTLRVVGTPLRPTRLFGEIPIVAFVRDSFAFVTGPFSH